MADDNNKIQTSGEPLNGAGEKAKTRAANVKTLAHEITGSDATISPGVAAQKAVLDEIASQFDPETQAAAAAAAKSAPVDVTKNMDPESAALHAKIQKGRQAIINELKDARPGCNSDEMTKEDADSFVKAMSQGSKIIDEETPSEDNVEKITRRKKRFDDDERVIKNFNSSRDQDEEAGYMSGIKAASDDELAEYEAKVAEQEAETAELDDLHDTYDL